LHKSRGRIWRHRWEQEEVTKEEEEGKLCSDRALGKRVLQGRDITVLIELKEASAAFPGTNGVFAPFPLV
jgi:hypothetical protein